ncbi:hypothetical protein ABVK25_000564 [Lepraria finkii]|uniref:Uncharacterized protein n=1 Tax=Lepraria finkii TaxID=1340010 RepID=A0ABR4BN90_9LECA
MKVVNYVCKLHVFREWIGRKGDAKSSLLEKHYNERLSSHVQLAGAASPDRRPLLLKKPVSSLFFLVPTCNIHYHPLSSTTVNYHLLLRPLCLIYIYIYTLYTPRT